MTDHSAQHESGVQSLIWLGLTVLPLVLALPVWAAEPEVSPQNIEFFESQVRPILVAHCYECHAGGESNGGLSLDSREGLLHGGDSGPALVPGNPAASLFVQAIRYRNPDLQMPPKGALSPSDIIILEKWIALGAPDPRTAAPSSASPRPTGMSIAEGREFWSFKPLSDVAIPRVEHSEWIRSPIDAFILARLEEKGIHPSPPADKRTLIRRMTFDLTGLPPTPEEVDAYLQDDSADATDRLMERLLASPQYGVRWGRHWLDIARYADSNGLDENLGFGNAWRYRDYVINSFNDDKSFDRFLIEQVAGDLVPGSDQNTKTATGYLVLGAKVLAEPDREKLVMDTIDEQLDSVGKAFLGMTLGCARCHDHKFDPIKQADYYALAAIFKSTRTFADSHTGAIRHWHEFSFATPEELAELKVIDAEIAQKKAAASKFKSAAMARLRDEARAHAVGYLVAAATFDPEMPLTDVEALARERGLHPRILRYTRLHLEYHRDDPLWSTWHQLAAAGDTQGIEQHYRSLFAEAEAAWEAAIRNDPKAKTLADERLETARSAIADPAGFLAVPPQPEFAFDAQTLAEYNRLAEESRLLEIAAPDEPAAMGVRDGDTHTALPIHIRGSHRNLGEPVARDFPKVMKESDRPPLLPAHGSGRLELAQWMAGPQHPLTARVYVNRVWRWHFGSGIVSTPDNFGRLGERPSHPELLDWLARHFVTSGWSSKDLHRLILRSSTYQMAGAHPETRSAYEVDPENRLLWKFPLQRLEAEELRDAILAVSGRLDSQLGGKTIPLRNRQFVFDHTSVDHTRYDSLRRAAYLPIVRNNVYTFFEQFDFPDPTRPTGSRHSTTVAPQALLMMNSELVMDSADDFARLLLQSAATDEDRVDCAFKRAFGRPATAEEIRTGIDFVHSLTAKALISAATVDPLEEQRAWSLLCQSLFASNEFLYVR